MWKCSKCGEEVEELFDVCWNCGTTSDGVEDPGFDKARRARQLMSSSPELDIAAAHETEQREAMERSWKGEKRHPCPDCGAPLIPIQLCAGTADGSSGESTVGYTTGSAERGWFRGAIRASGQINAQACPDCGRVLLFAGSKH